MEGNIVIQVEHTNQNDEQDSDNSDSDLFFLGRCCLCGFLVSSSCPTKPYACCMSCEEILCQACSATHEGSQVVTFCTPPMHTDEESCEACAPTTCADCETEIQPHPGQFHFVQDADDLETLCASCYAARGNPDVVDTFFANTCTICDGCTRLLREEGTLPCPAQPYMSCHKCQKDYCSQCTAAMILQQCCDTEMMGTSCYHGDVEQCSACTPVCAGCSSETAPLNPVPILLNEDGDVARVCDACFPHYVAVDPQNF